MKIQPFGLCSDRKCFVAYRTPQNLQIVCALIAHTEYSASRFVPIGIDYMCAHRAHGISGQKIPPRSYKPRTLFSAAKTSGGGGVLSTFFRRFRLV